jgi:outer membrane protein OmpA-like peptidoglycan-associated protein
MKKLILPLIAMSLHFASHAQNGWTLGGEKGHAVIAGEISPLSGFAFGFFAEKNFSSILSARLQWGMGDMRGQEHAPGTRWTGHPVWSGQADPAIDYAKAPVRYVYANYQTSYMEGSLQAVFTFTRLPFFRNESPFDLYLLGGVSAMRHMTQVDAAAADGGIYNYAAVNNLGQEPKARALAELSAVMDGRYETAVSDQPAISPMYQVGGGLKWKISGRLGLALSYRMGLSNTDALDSYSWSAGNDVQHFTSLSIGYAISRREKPSMPAGPVLPAGAPEFESVEIPLTTIEEDIVRRAFDNLEFETNQAIIRPESFASLNELATLLAEHPDWKLSIAGHTDNVGTEAFNMDLSKRRAEAVRDYLIARGIAAGRFYLSWYGESRPVAGNDTEEGRQRNRRVEMKIVE